jgi:hypothetical protein
MHIKLYVSLLEPSAPRGTKTTYGQLSLVLSDLSGLELMMLLRDKGAHPGLGFFFYKSKLPIKSTRLTNSRLRYAHGFVSMCLYVVFLLFDDCIYPIHSFSTIFLDHGKAVCNVVLFSNNWGLEYLQASGPCPFI